MAFHRKRYEESLRQKFLNNPGKENRKNRKDTLNANRGKRVPATRVVRDARRTAERRRTAKEIREFS
jgi:hypothetical protein